MAMKRIKNVIYNSTGYGSVTGMLMRHDFDPGALRPILANNGVSYLSLSIGKFDHKKHRVLRENVPLHNAEAALTRDEWKVIDRAIVRAAQPRLKAWADLRSANSITIPNGMGKTVLETTVMGDITGAQISMDGLSIADQDRLHFDIAGVPLPIIHKDFSISLRQLAISRNSSVPLDTTLAELAGRKVAEEIEKLTIGTGDGYTFAGRGLYGYKNFPGRQTKEITHPEETGWTPKTLVQEILEMVIMMQDQGYYGPYRVYIGRGWTLYLEQDYSDTKGDNTLRARIARLEGLSGGLQTLDYLDPFDIVMVQQTQDVARGVVGLDLTTMQWEQQGGMEIKMKVMAIMVPNLRGDFYGNCGIVHATAVNSDES